MKNEKLAGKPIQSIMVSACLLHFSSLILHYLSFIKSINRLKWCSASCGPGAASG